MNERTKTHELITLLEETAGLYKKKCKRSSTIVVLCMGLAGLCHLMLGMNYSPIFLSKILALFSLQFVSPPLIFFGGLVISILNGVMNVFFTYRHLSHLDAIGLVMKQMNVMSPNMSEETRCANAKDKLNVLYSGKSRRQIPKPLRSLLRPKR